MPRCANSRSSIISLPQSPSYESVYQVDDIEELYGEDDQQYYQIQAGSGFIGLMVGTLVFVFTLVLAPNWTFEHLGLISLLAGLTAMFGRGGVFASEYAAGFGRTVRLTFGALALIGGLAVVVQDAANLDFLPEVLQIAQGAG